MSASCSPNGNMKKRMTPLQHALLKRTSVPMPSFDEVQAKLKTDRSEYEMESDGQVSLETLLTAYFYAEEEE